MTLDVTAGLVCAGVAAGLFYLASLASQWLAGPDDRIRKRLERERQESSTEAPVLAFKDLRKLAAEALADGPPTLRRRFATMVEHSGLSVSPTGLIGIAVACALTGGVLVAFLRPEPGLAVPAGAIAGLLPLLYARHKARQRDEKLLSQLPEILDLTSRFLKAGYSLPQALGSVAGELKDPAKALFTRYVTHRDLGLPTDVTLRDLADEAGLTEYRIFVMAILVQQQTGGNMAEVCDRLAKIVRERFRVKGMIRALTAEGRMQANILMAMPPALVVIMMGVKPSYAEAMKSSPKLIAGILISQLLGILWIRKIINVKF